MVYDEEHRPCDFVYLDVNAAFVGSTGLRDVVGKRTTEVFPGIRTAKPDLMEIYGGWPRPAAERVECSSRRALVSRFGLQSQKDHFVP
jgi:hypothetical protein